MLGMKQIILALAVAPWLLTAADLWYDIVPTQVPPASTVDGGSSYALDARTGADGMPGSAIELDARARTWDFSEAIKFRSTEPGGFYLIVR